MESKANTLSSRTADIGRRLVVPNCLPLPYLEKESIELIKTEELLGSLNFQSSEKKVKKKKNEWPKSTMGWAGAGRGDSGPFWFRPPRPNGF